MPAQPKKATTPKARKASGTPRRRKGVTLRPTGLGATDLLLADLPAEIGALGDAVRADGGAVLCAYREPLGGHALLLVALPIDLVVPTPFQRDISDTHVMRLTRAMDKTRRYLDPIIAVREITEAGRYWTPNGYHRLTAMKELGARTILALLVPERAVAYQILALNIEKAHNLREKAIGTMRMLRDLERLDPARSEEDYALELEESALVTLGFAYEKRPRLSGGAYHGVLRKVDAFAKGALPAAVAERERRAALLLALDDAVGEVVDKLKAKGFVSPYLRPFVIARVNPLRFIKGEPPPLDELLAGMTKRARGMNVDKISAQDVVRTGGAPDASE